MTTKDGWKDGLRAALLDNFGLKVVSFMVALGFYAYVHGAENAQRTVEVSVLSIMPPESANRQLMTQLPTSVAVTLRGSRTQLDDLKADDLGSLQIDLKSGRETRIDLEPSMFHVPPGIEVQQMYPSTIELRWDDVIARQLPIQVARTGEPPPGFTVKGAIVVEPANVTARGPRSVVEVLQFARATPYDVAGLTEGAHRRNVALDRPPKLVAFDLETATATVEIARELMKKEYTLKVEVVGLPRATTQPKQVKVVVTGPTEQLSSLLAEAIVPRVEPKSAGIDTNVPGSAMLDVVVEVPQAKVEVNPGKVLVKW